MYAGYRITLANGIFSNPTTLFGEGKPELANCAIGDLPYPLPEGIEVIALLSGETQVLLGPRRRPDLRVRFNAEDMRWKYGKAWLVGMGPGDPELMTLKADSILRRADIIFYDSLMDRAVLDRYSAECIHVGKRKGHHIQQQHEINQSLYEAARAGRIVVRLKGGDPLIFGRGGEEAEYLLRRLIPVEIVPGISAAQAAAASTNASLTKRGISRSLVFHTVHEGELSSDEAPTRVYYMGASRLAQLSQRLLRKGLDPYTPVTLVQNASFVSERSVSTTVAGMSTVELASPIVVIVGRTACDQRFDGKCLYTGNDPYGFCCPERVVHYPLGRKRTPTQINLDSFATVAFSSVSAVDEFAKIYGGLPGDLLYYCAGDEMLAYLQTLAPGVSALSRNCR
jgi:uroporphyrinogen III methyltransferase / synthase